LTDEEVERGIGLLIESPGLAPKVAFYLLRENCIGDRVSDHTLRRVIVNVARDRWRTKPRP
jgi:hypothetical protein